MSATDISVYGDLADDVVADVARTVAELRNLRQILNWGATLSPARKPEQVLAQDEYTHDVVMRYADGVYVVFDVT